MTAVPAMRPQGTPKAVVRQYALATGLKQGELASALKSWNSLNRNTQAYLNNMNNPKSLPGLQIAYIRENLKSQAALDSFIALGGDPSSPPAEADYAAAQAVLDAQAALDAQALLDAEAAAPGTYTPDEVAAAEALVSAYSGDPQAVIDAYSGDDPQTVVDQYDAWSDYQTAETAAQDAFAAASVSYGASYDQAKLDEVRSYVDAIVEMKELDTLVADFDAATAASETTTAASAAE
ncbi:MAG: hypothetical protein Q8P46_09340 [Hyphomicrobiales bacterium]|nr:hypothetical protein [Hyphomicrobiales bacterium]